MVNAVEVTEERFKSHLKKLIKPFEDLRDDVDSDKGHLKQLTNMTKVYKDDAPAPSIAYGGTKEIHKMRGGLDTFIRDFRTKIVNNINRYAVKTPGLQSINESYQVISDEYKAIITL